MIIKLFKGQFLQKQFRKELMFINKLFLKIVILELLTPMHLNGLPKLY